MSSEGVVVIEDADHSVTTGGMANETVNKESVSPSPRESVAPLDSGVEPKKECETESADTRSSADTSEEEAKNHVSDDGDHAKSAADDFAEPDDELRNKIIKQVEFYFSDANILKDTFLLKHVRRNKMGYVGVKLIANFKKVKSLTKDIRVVVFSLRHSAELEVNEQGTKIRRRTPMPEHDETTPFRTVVAVNLEQKNPSVDSVAKEFSNCSGITLIRIIRPGHTTVPPDVNKYANKHREIGTTVCAVIEFEKEEQARKACKTMTNTEDWRSGRRVVLLSNQKQKREKQGTTSENNVAPEDGGGKSRKKKTVAGKKKNHGDHKADERTLSGGGSSSDGDGSGSPRSHACNGVVDSKSKRASPRSSPGSSPYNQKRQHHGRPQTDTTSRNGVHRPNPHKNTEMSRSKAESSPGENSPWMQRRLRAAQDGKSMGGPGMGQGSGDGPSPRNSKLLDMVGVLRQPKGPDGTTGFCGLGRGKPRCNTIA